MNSCGRRTAEQDAAMQTEPSKADPTKRKRRWFQFSLRTLMIVVTLLTGACAYLSLVVLVGCEPRSGPSAGQSSHTSSDKKVGQDDQVERLFKQIRLCPPWTRIKASDQQSKQNVITCLDSIANNDTSRIRKAVERVAHDEDTSNYSVDELSKLFLLNRYLFKVPSKSNMADARFFGGWGGVPHDEEHVDLLWPFAVNSAGKLELTGGFGGYYGDIFEAVDEFDYFNRRFGRRDHAFGR
jgi:hypothetical protein